MKNANGKIGIGITTRNRHEIFSECLAQVKMFLPKGAKLVIVDDASTIPVKGATYTFDENVGIATAKNKCLELLDGCEHIFLFDDDCFPTRAGWEKPYIESKEPHLMYLFQHYKHSNIAGSEVLHRDSELVAMSQARGCMVYFHSSVIEAVGGYDTRYEKWGYEHADLSNRIHNLGFTTFPFADVYGSDKLFYSADEHQKVQTTVSYDIRVGYLAKTEAKYQESKTSKSYFPYKKSLKENCIIITSFLNAHEDTQRHLYWDADYSKLTALMKSVNGFGRKLVILNNCFPEKHDTKLVAHVPVKQYLNPYFQRWLSSLEYLRENPQIEFCFLVDGTDVELMNDRLDDLKKGVLYVGDEPSIVGCRWMVDNAYTVELFEFMKGNTSPLLNCGVVGGDRETVMKLCSLMVDCYETHPEEKIDMSLLNFVLYTKWDGEIEYGRHITTLFRGDERKTDALFKHK